MFLVSGPELALAVCREGLIGSFPAHSTRTSQELDRWLCDMQTGIAASVDQGLIPAGAPYAVNLVVHSTNQRMQNDLELIIRHKVPMVITSKGAPGEIVQRIQEYGGIVFSDIASYRHAEKAIASGVDGLIAVCAGAGGHTGRLNPFAFMNEIREIYDGPVVLAGGMTTGRDVAAAEMMGATFVYMGTRFINTRESLATMAHKQMIVRSRATDIFYTAALDGAPANFLSESLLGAGFDLEVLAVTKPGGIVSVGGTKRWKDIWSAGHGVGTVHDIPTASELCLRIISQYETAKLQSIAREIANNGI